jgi:hypothetical protein
MNERQEPEMLLQAGLVLIRFFTTLLLNIIGWYGEVMLSAGGAYSDPLSCLKM